MLKSACDSGASARTIKEGSPPSGSVNMRLHNVALGRALDIIFRQNGFAWEYEGSEVRLRALDTVEGSGNQVYARYLSDYLHRRDQDELSSSERDYIDDIRDSYNLTDREIERIRDMPISARALEDAYDEMRRYRDDDYRRDTYDTRRDRPERAPTATSQQRAAGLAHMIQGVIDPGRWRVSIQ